MCTETGMAEIPRNPRETRRDGDKVEKSCGNPAEMEVSLAGFPRGWKKIFLCRWKDSGWQTESAQTRYGGRTAVFARTETLGLDAGVDCCSAVNYLHSFVLIMCIYNILLLSCQCARGWGCHGLGWKKFTAGMGGDGDEMPWGWVGTAMKLCGDGWGWNWKPWGRVGTGVIYVPVHISTPMA